MTHNHLQQLFEYDHSSNAMIIEALKNYPSSKEEMQKLFSHIFNALYIWIDRIEGKEMTFPVWQIHALEDMPAINNQIHQRIEGILEKEAELDSSIFYHNTQGEQFESKLFDILFHLVNHGTHHRAQIVRMLREGGVVPPRLDYIFYKR